MGLFKLPPFVFILETSFPFTMGSTQSTPPEDSPLGYLLVTEKQMGSCCLLPTSRQNAGGKDFVIKERSLYSKATQFWNNTFPQALVS